MKPNFPCKTGIFNMQPKIDLTWLVILSKHYGNREINMFFKISKQQTSNICYRKTQLSPQFSLTFYVFCLLVDRLP